MYQQKQQFKLKWMTKMDDIQTKGDAEVPRFMHGRSWTTKLAKQSQRSKKTTSIHLLFKVKLCSDVPRKLLAFHLGQARLSSARPIKSAILRFLETIDLDVCV